MKIILTKRNGRNGFSCTRSDGSTTQADLGPDFPYHDLAHLVVEDMLQLRKGFYGYLDAGHTVLSLSDKEVIRSLDPEIWYSEIVTRNVQSLSSGACSNEECHALIAWELREMPQVPYTAPAVEQIDSMLKIFREYCNSWDELHEGECLRLEIF